MLSQLERMKLKAVTQLLVREAGGQDACAAASERIRRHQSFSEYSDRQRTDRFISIDTVAEIERFAGAPTVTRALAELAQCVLVPLPQVCGSLSKLDKISGQVLKEIGELFTKLGEARSDGMISQQENTELKVEIRDAVTMLLRLEQQLNAEVQGNDE